MAKKSIAKNYIYNLIYQMLTILLPLVTTPYLSRVLGAEAIGIYGYTLSIVTYFVLFGSLGIALYGQREIAYVQNSKKKQAQVFWEIVSVRIITLFFSTLLFYLTFCMKGEYATYYTILLLELVASALDISWYFQGIEDFGKTVTRNIVVKFMSIVCIFLFVKTQSDLWKYILIYTLANVLGNGTMWLYIPKLLPKVSFKNLKLKRHIKPTLSLFVPQIATQVYVVLDKTMIGNITNDMSAVGYYEQSQKIIKTLILLVTALGTVMSSRIANSFGEKNKKAVKEYLKQSFRIVWMLGIPAMFGIIAIASKLVPWFYGEGFEQVIPLMIAISPIILAISLNNVTGVQYLIQVKKQNIYMISVIIGAIVNVSLNLILISRFGTLGAVIASVVAEFSVFGYQLYNIRKEISWKEIIESSPIYWFSGICMFGVTYMVTKMLSVSVWNTFLEIMIGGIVYFLILFLLKDSFLKAMINQVITTIQNRRNSHDQ